MDKIKSRTYVDVRGFPPDMDLYMVVPKQSFMFGEECKPILIPQYRLLCTAP